MQFYAFGEGNVDRKSFPGTELLEKNTEHFSFTIIFQ